MAQTWRHFSDVDKISQLVQNDMPTAAIWSKSKPKVKFQYSGRLFFQTRNSYISAADWVITAKFGLLMTDWHQKKWHHPEVKLRRSYRHLENRYNIIILLLYPPTKRRWTNFDEIRKPNAEWHAEYGGIVKIETGSKISIWRTIVFPNLK